MRGLSGIRIQGTVALVPTGTAQRLEETHMVQKLIALSQEPAARRIARQMAGRGLEEVGKLLEQHGRRMQSE